MYILLGGVRPAAKAVGIEPKTGYLWLKADWWPLIYDEAKREFAELIEARLSDILEKATAAILERIENGDEVLSKQGKIVRVKVAARDLNTIVRDSIDKMRLLQNKPTKMTAELTVDLNKLEKNFAELADKYKDRIVSTQ